MLFKRMSFGMVGPVYELSLASVVKRWYAPPGSLKLINFILSDSLSISMLMVVVGC